MIAHPLVAFIVDEVTSVVPPRAQGIEIRGTTQVRTGAGSTEGGLSGDIIRLTPDRIISWGIDGAGTRARNV